MDSHYIVYGIVSYHVLFMKHWLNCHTQPTMYTSVNITSLWSTRNVTFTALSLVKQSVYVASCTYSN